MVQRLEKVRKELEKEQFVREKGEGKLQAVINCLKDQVDGNSKSIDEDLELLELMQAIVLDFGGCSINKSENDSGLMDTLKSNKMARRIFGYRNMEQLMRQFQVRANGFSRSIRVQPQHLRWFW